MDSSYRQLKRPNQNRMIAGVCAGLGEYSSIDPTVIRLIAVVLFFLTGPGIVLAYLIMALIIPPEPVAQA